MTEKPDEQASFEQLLEQLEQIVSRMEAGNLPLEETLQEFERGQTLAAQCEQRLRDATQRVNNLLKEADPDADGGSAQ
ncbi:MAG: exodeoxyribonuclease VII small subunit [Algiphilus sp.]